MAAVGVIERIVAQNLGVYRAAPSRLQEDLSQEAQVANDYRGRLVYELLQNADDAMEGQASHRDRVAFLVTPDGLWMANSGRPLSDADVQGLCGLGASSKVDSGGTKRASIGHKGLGFKSVLEITAQPAAFSTTHAFELGERHARPAIEALFDELDLPTPTGVPSMRFPAPLDPAPSAWATFRERNYKTAFHFPFRAELRQDQRQDIGDLLLSLPFTTVLFLKHLEEIEVTIDDGTRHLTRTWTVERAVRAGDAWERCTGFKETGLYRVTVRSEAEAAHFLVGHESDVAIGSHRAGLSGPAWEGVNTTEVSVAVVDPADGATTMPDEWRRFHVFLPTQEHSPYPMLVNGAFSTDLSRQRVRVTADVADYNAHLIRVAADVFVDHLLPALRASSTETVLSCLERLDRGSSDEAGSMLHNALCAALADLPLLSTEAGADLSITETVVPATVLGDAGEGYRNALRSDAAWEGRRFPDAPLCRGRLAGILADHGATELRGEACLAALASQLDQDRTRLRDDDGGGFEIDPVLDLCVMLWDLSEPAERAEITTQARFLPLFPIHRNEDRTVERVTLGDDIAFYPPRAARHELPLGGLRFMCQSICWGALLPKERTALLDERMAGWGALFEIREFRFEEVMRAAVIPALVLNPTGEALELRDRLASIDALSAICQLAGALTKPDRPLRYQRLGSDRALFNLSRLPVPCRGTDGIEWVPAYRAYFGSDWTGAESVETILEACTDDTESRPTFTFLASPDVLLGTLRDLDQPVDTTEDDDDEVGLDEDTDQAGESDERARWIAFLSWIGVNKSLRAIHFHDVEDDNTGWLTTKGLQQPQGWAFANLQGPWESFQRRLHEAIAARTDRDEMTPYLYEAHDLDQLVSILHVSEGDPDGGVGRALFEHVARHWASLSTFSRTQVALVQKDKWPGARSKPPKAMQEELHDLGDNLWMQRLRERASCPTTLGPRRPELSWLPSPEIERRFSRRGRDSSALLPLLDISDGVPATSRRSLAERLGIRAELSPSTFTFTDAELLCRRLELLYPANPDDQAWREPLRTVIRPVYRQMFELLTGQSTDPTLRGALADVPLLAETSDGYQFLPGHQILYAQSAGIRERSGIGASIPMFVLEAEPAATAALTNLFGVRVLEDSLEWHPNPGECPFENTELAEVRASLTDLAAPLLARIRAERSESRDGPALTNFLERVEPVSSLELSCTLDGVALPLMADRIYFVPSRSSAKSTPPFVVWSGEPWPLDLETAQALGMAIADALGINLVETFIAFIQSSPDQRTRLLQIAGAGDNLPDAAVDVAQGSPNDVPTDGDSPKTTDPTVGADPETPAAPPDAAQSTPAAPPVPLRRFEELMIDGEPILVFGEEGPGPTGGGADGSARATAGAGGNPRVAAAGTDLEALDALGMQITLTFEHRRLHRAGHSDAALLVGKGDPVETSTMIVDVHSPRAIREAEDRSPVVKEVMAALEAQGISRLFPGFDLLAIRDGHPDRLIELKSSGVDARVQAMSWNEWKSARASAIRARFWLYLVGNLRADIGSATPYVRAIHDPFGSLVGDVVEDAQVRRAVQLRVREFKVAEHLDLGVAPVQTQVPDAGGA